MTSVQIRSFKNGDLRSKSMCSVQIQENTDQEKLRIWTIFTKWITMIPAKLDGDLNRDYKIIH